MRVHHLPGSRSCRVVWLLEELEIPYELDSKALTDGSLRAPEYRVKNPLGRVPTLEDDDAVFYESGAIVQYLLEKYGHGRLEPAVDSPSRTTYLQWFHWGEATLMPPIVLINGNRFVLKEKDRSDAALRVARRQLAKILSVLDDALQGEDFLVDGELSAADIMVAYGVTNGRMTGELSELPPGIQAWMSRLEGRPAYARAFEGGFGS